MEEKKNPVRGKLVQFTFVLRKCKLDVIQGLPINKFFTCLEHQNKKTREMKTFSCVSKMSSFLFITFLVVLPIINGNPMQLTLLGPRHPVTASLRETIVLHCHLSPRTNVQNMEIAWFRSQNSSYIHLYHSGKDHLEQQQLEYQGRTEFLKDGIGDGKIGLKIFNISLFDEGHYHCSIKNGSFQQEATLDMKVTGYQDGGIRVVCRSSGWYPKPEVLWRELNGRLLSSLAKKDSQRNDGTFDVQADIVLKGSSNLTCVIRNSLLDLEKESTIHITNHLFPKISSWIVALCFSLMAVVGFSIFIFYLLNKYRKLDTELNWRNMVMPIEKANIVLDPETANHDLILSADQRTVIQGFMWQSLPYSPKRFNMERCVLGSEGFSSGKHYWEVEVGEDGYWALGVARNSMKRKGKLILVPEEGIWAVGKDRIQYKALTLPKIPLILKKKPRKLGVYLDYEMQLVAFHDVNHQTHIFTFFSAPFNGEAVFPFFYVGVGCWLRMCPW
ncbi:butyrophilin subfamily 2 member A2-like isoform X2 [Crotalus tigris]|uniref:butyrophilin subfamily 2 member A2-like isoform X2 n=1 Tax=Crotalus tigris TaxID=88082 RepID=UPI00192F7F9C|nr:butyrophilin subfamily 2 member A2-like isoform X2 [Crotalus tigris]